MTRKPLRPFVLGIDPGMITGLAWLRVADLSSFRSCELPFMETGATIKDICETYGHRLDVACERFTISMRTVRNTPAPWSLEVIGVARYFCQIYTGLDLELYEAKPGFSTDARLKIMDWYRPSKGGHMNDAGRQLLNHLVVRGFRDPRLWSEEVDKLSTPR